jgi:hypothetical protein
MADPILFEFTSPSTWIPSFVAGGAGIYGLFRIFKRDSRNDHQERQVDEAVQQIISGLRTEVERLTVRVGSMEKEIVRLHQEKALFHEERAALLARLAECQTVHGQTGLF